MQMSMRWLRLVGSLKVQVSFAKEPYKRDYILQKRPSLLLIAAPYEYLHSAIQMYVGHTRTKIYMKTYMETYMNKCMYVSTYLYIYIFACANMRFLDVVYIHCNTLQHTATHYNTLQHNAYETRLIDIRHDSFIHVRHDLCTWDMTHSCETWLIYMRHDSFTGDMTRPYETCLVHIRHDSFIWDVAHSYETWLMHETCELKTPKCPTHWHVTWLIDMWHDSLTWDNHIDMTHERDTRSERERRQDTRRGVWWNFSRVSSEVIFTQ